MNNNFVYNKIIYQTYECDFDGLHEIFKNSCQLWKETYPDWEYHFSSSEQRREEIKQCLNLSKDALEAYDREYGIVQSDLWRFAITSKNGGMYSDLDSIPKQNIENLLDSIDRPVDLFAPIDGYQLDGDPGSGTSNFVFATNSLLGQELSRLVYEYLEIAGFLNKTEGKTMHFETMKQWLKFVNLNKDRIAQEYSPEYYYHNNSLKPPNYHIQRPRFEKNQVRAPNIYSEEWKILYDKAKTMLQ